MNRSEFNANRALAAPRIWTVECGTLRRVYHTEYHAEQLASALRRHKPLSGAPVIITPPSGVKSHD